LVGLVGLIRPLLLIGNDISVSRMIKCADLVVLFTIFHALGVSTGHEHLKENNRQAANDHRSLQSLET
jgi:hypothetical protein